MAHDPDEAVRIEPFRLAAGGWTSVKEVAHALGEANIRLAGPRILLKQNKPDGFACVSCSWAKPAHPHPAEFCEHGAKATAWELTTDRCTPAFFAQHTLTELEEWSDLELESTGRLTAPMRWDAKTDKYVETSWDAAFAEIGRRLRALEPKSAVFYMSGRASLETAYMYGLMARLYGNNNLPDSSNMCHESTSVGLPKSIGVPVGTVQLEDFPQCDCIVVFGHNIGTNAPRMLHDLQDCRERGVPLITFNPLKEPGLVRFANPQSPTQMLTPADTTMSTQHHQLKAGGDLAAISGLCKALVERDDAARTRGEPPVLDHAFIAQHTHGFHEFAVHLRQLAWADIEAGSGLAREDLESAAKVISRAKRLIAIYGMGLTQHREGVANVQMVANLCLLGGHIGVPGAGILPVRGHSNVQGQRTVGITEKPEMVPAAKLKALYGFDIPTEKGLTTVETCQGLIDGSVEAVVSLGGNLLRAVPDQERVEAAWRRLPLSVNIATKLNRTHLIHGEAAWLLPCLGRTEIDRQAGGPQHVSVEDSMSMVHLSAGINEPASPHLLSEPTIVARLAEATLPTSKTRWRWLAEDHDRIRDQIEAVFDDFKGFNERVHHPGGFRLRNTASERVWLTSTGKARFMAHPIPTDTAVHRARQARQPDLGPVFTLTTVRAHDQYNTTVYGLDDRYRGVFGQRRVVFIHTADRQALGLAEGAWVDLRSCEPDGQPRRAKGFKLVDYSIPRGCVAAYYPETNGLIALDNHAVGARTPASKSIPVQLIAVAAPDVSQTSASEATA